MVELIVMELTSYQKEMFSTFNQLVSVSEKYTACL